ncbi:MAG: hypothetical protein RIC87_00385 [Kiloniellales bacterium]
MADEVSRSANDTLIGTGVSDDILGLTANDRQNGPGSDDRIFG